MDQRALASDLNALLASENASLAQHLAEAKPYVNAQTFRIWRHLEKVQHDSVEHAQRIVALLTSIGAEVRPRPFNQSVANFHYMDLATLVPLLITEKKQQAATYQQAIAHAAGSPAAAELTALLAECNDHLAHLQASVSQLAAV